MFAWRWVGGRGVGSSDHERAQGNLGEGDNGHAPYLDQGCVNTVKHQTVSL